MCECFLCARLQHSSQIQSSYLLSPVVSVDWWANQTTNQTQRWTAFNFSRHDLLKTNMPFCCHIQLSAFYRHTFEEEIEAAAFRPSHTAASIHESFIRPHEYNAAAKTSGLKDYSRTSHFKPFQDVKGCFSILSLIPVDVSERINLTGINRHGLHIKYHSLI